MRGWLLLGWLLVLGARGWSAGPVPAGAGLEALSRELTRQLIQQLQDPDFRMALGSRLQPEVTRLSLNALANDYAAQWPTPDHLGFRDRLLGLDLQVRQAKGLVAFSRGLLGLEVIWPRAGPRVLDWGTVLFGITPDGPRRRVQQLEAYDPQGGLHLLDARQQPGTLVLMAGTDPGEAKRAGIDLINAGLRQANYAPVAGSGPEPIHCSLLTQIRLADTQEPWWKGAAEVYAFTIGIDSTVDRPALELVNLPYVAYPNIDYYPNQLVLFWNRYRFNAADFQLWEQDSNINYQDALSAILVAVGAAMTVGGAPVFAWIPALADAIIKAMPSAWFKDNDDYLDTFYTLQRDQSYLQYSGAGHNATITLQPFVLQP
jgi:hypothetical protein